MSHPVSGQNIMTELSFWPHWTSQTRLLKGEEATWIILPQEPWSKLHTHFQTEQQEDHRTLFTIQLFWQTNLSFWRHTDERVFAKPAWQCFPTHITQTSPTTSSCLELLSNETISFLLVQASCLPAVYVIMVVVRYIAAAGVLHFHCVAVEFPPNVLWAISFYWCSDDSKISQCFCLRFQKWEIRLFGWF